MTCRDRVPLPSLDDPCFHQWVIDNVRYLGNVGETDFETLELILPHCTLEQLKHVEDSTKGRDLSPVTDKLWEKFFEREFGSKMVDVVVERMEKTQLEFSWRELYEGKLKETEDREQKVAERMRERYKMEEAKKRSRQIVVLCDNIPPSTETGKRKLSQSCSSITTKGNLMKKAKLESVNCREVQNLEATKMKMVRRTAGVSPATTSSSASRNTKKAVARKRF